MGRCYNWYDLPDNPERVGDEDYNPQPRPEMDEDEAYELGVSANGRKIMRKSETLKTKKNENDRYC